MGNDQLTKTTLTELTEKQINMLKTVTKYTENEIRQWHEGFIRDCPNGRLDKKRFIQDYQKFHPEGKVDNYCKYAFNTFDTNNDGTIDFQEFLLAIAASVQGSIDDRLGFAFDVYDISHDRVIDQKELTAIIVAIYDLLGETDRKGDHDPKKVAADIIAQLDVNGDKKLNKAEFITGCKHNESVARLLAPSI